MAHSSITKRMIVGVAAIVFVLSFSIDIFAQAYQRNVFVEEFTGTWCGYCPRGAWYMDSLEANMPDNAVLIAWHNNDQMKIANGEPVMAANWGITSYPNMLVNRYDYKGGIGDWADLDPSNPDQIYPMVIQPSAQSTPLLNFQITNISYAPTTKTVAFDLLVSPNAPGQIPTEDTAEYRTVVVLTEDSVIYDQTNYGLRGLPDPIKKFRHDNVGRMVSGDVLGNKFNMLTATPNAQYPVKIHYSMKITSTIFKPAKMRIKTMVETVAPAGAPPQAHIVRNAAQSNYITSYPTPKPGTITITKPAAGDVLTGGTTGQEIAFTASTEVTSSKTFSFSPDNGSTWTPIGTISSNATSYFGWDVPNTATTQGLIKIVDGNGATATSGVFTIKAVANVGSISNAKISGLDNANPPNIASNKATTITWTTNGGDVGANLIVEYSVDNTITWHAVGAPVAPTAISTPWTTPNGYYANGCFVRVRSADVDKSKMTTISSEFSIGAAAAVHANAANGYSILNYPNPFGASTTIKFELPHRSFVTIRIQDELGREIDKLVTETFDAGSHSITYNAANISNGVYTYTLEAGATKLVGKMSVVK